MCRKMFILAVAALAAFNAVEAKTVILIGDSLSEYSKNTVATFCGGSVNVNNGIGGTTAAQWRTQEEDSDMYVPRAIKTKSGQCGDVIVVSLGGNDQLETKCPKSNLNTIKGYLTAILTQINTVCPNAKIYMVGYP